MTSGPTFDDIFRVMAAASVGDEAARVEVAPGSGDDIPTRFAVALNLLLDELAFRAERQRRVLSEQRRAEEAVRASEERYRTMFEQSPVPMIVYDTEARSIAGVNGAAVHHYGYPREEFERISIDEILLPGEADRAGSDSRSTQHRRRDGSLMHVEARAHDVVLSGRKLRLLIADDVTERRRLEQQLQQGQKMEAVGRLAGGVAHDFNNLLSVIVGYGDSIMSSLSADDPLREDVAEICRAAARAAELTRQLLTFSRQRAIEPTLLDLNEVLEGMSRMLERAVGVDIRLVTRLSRPLGSVNADAGSVEQVIMNLVVNARDVMSSGGEIVVETADVLLDESYVHTHLGVSPGWHVMLAVSDTGGGMDAATQARIFEPFFTTKPRGKGTGLGLSTVFGIVRQCGGSISLDSKVGEGTVFRIYFPRVDAPATEPRAALPTQAPRGSETVLLVEDDDQVRRMTNGILTRAGYHVIEARNGIEAIAIAEQHVGNIHLLLTDVVMPQMSGPELVRRLAKVRPEMRALCVSGYTDDIALERESGDERIAFLQKPTSPESLRLKVREVLDAG